MHHGRVSGKALLKIKTNGSLEVFSPNMWPVKNKTALYDHQEQCHVWCKANTSHHAENTIPTGRHSDSGNNVEMAFIIRDWETGQSGRKMDVAKNRTTVLYTACYTPIKYSNQASKDGA